MSELLGVGVRVPCSTSNLGSGFDTIGLALDRYLEVTFAPGTGSLTVERTGTLAGIECAQEDNLVVVAFRQALSALGHDGPSGTLRMRSDIPIARGLGSSAAAVLAGADLARAACGLDPDPEGAFRTAFQREGHGDNAGPCLYGGLCAVLPVDSGPRIVGLPLSRDIGWAYAAPSGPVETRTARAALPSLVSHDVAARALGHVTALVRGLAEGDPELLRIGFEDELHVPHRLPMIPGSYNAIGAGYDAGAWAVTLSGAGSGLIAACSLDDAAKVAAAMGDVFSSGAYDPEGVAVALNPDFEGLRRTGPAEID